MFADAPPKPSGTHRTKTNERSGRQNIAKATLYAKQLCAEGSGRFSQY
jgi:hypothetical protein